MSDTNPELDLYDIQGNIVFGYGRWGYPVARYVFFSFIDEKKSREFITSLVPLVTSSAPLDAQNGGVPPSATTNLALTYSGLRELGLPDESMRSFPEDFRMGMKARKAILGDDGPSAPENWDPIWQDNYKVHMLMTINAQSPELLEERYQTIMALLENVGSGVKLLTGHRGPDGVDDLPYQPGNAIVVNGKPTPFEHFHYTDGISDPIFRGQGRSRTETIGAGKARRDSPTVPISPESADGWEPLETGEFLLGHRDEASEYPIAPMPRLLSYNGSFMVYRKLHQNVGDFTNYLKEASKDYGDPECSPEEREETLKAKFAGRWSNGAPLASYPDYKSAQEFGKKWENAVNTLFYDPNATDEQKASARDEYEALKIKRRAFNYNFDLEGAKCPLGAHTRRSNPRGSLEFDNFGAYNLKPGALVDRRRILRRGLPYGDSSDRNDSKGDHGIVFMAINASIERQFEFVQQQWINYGNDFKLSNEKDVLLGNHATDEDGNPAGRTVINGNKELKQPVFTCSGMPRFIETHGGDYFFIPSLTALRMIGEGIIDPT